MIVLLVTDKDGVSTHLNIGCVDMAFTTVGILVDEHPNVANILVTKTDAPFEDRDEAEYKRAGEYQEFVTGVMQKFEEQMQQIAQEFFQAVEDEVMDSIPEHEPETPRRLN